MAALVLAGGSDPDATALARCLDDPSNAATSGQTDCEARAARAYDRRMNAAYAALLRELPPAVAQQFRQSQRAWLAFRDAEARARDAFYATRQGTMYVPMQASDATNIVRDRALQLEAMLRGLRIDE